MKLKSDKELKADTLRETEGFRLTIRGTVDDGFYLMAVRDEIQLPSQQTILSYCLYLLKNNDNEIIERIKKRYEKFKEEG